MSCNHDLMNSVARGNCLSEELEWHSLPPPSSFYLSFLPGVRWWLVYLHEYIPGLWEAVCGKALSENRPAGLPAPQKDT